MCGNRAVGMHTGGAPRGSQKPLGRIRLSHFPCSLPLKRQFSAINSSDITSDRLPLVTNGGIIFLVFGGWVVGGGGGVGVGGVFSCQTRKYSVENMFGG